MNQQNLKSLASSLTNIVYLFSIFLDTSEAGNEQKAVKTLMHWRGKLCENNVRYDLTE